MSVGKKILLVDDDDLLRQMLIEQLQGQDDFDLVDEADCGTKGLELAQATVYDIILLDVDMPDMDGREVCRQMREKGVRAPIIMLTGMAGDDDTVEGLDAGANDYITKPFRLAVLLARLRAHMRQHEQSDDAIFAIGPYAFQPAAKMLQDDITKRKIKLTEKETAILKYLYRARPSTVPRDQLLGEVWGYNAGVTTHTLETHIYRLRQKIEPNPSQATILVTEQGGYRLGD